MTTTFRAEVSDEQGRLVSTLYYLKMSIIGSIEKEVSNAWTMEVKPVIDNYCDNLQREQIVNHLKRDAKQHGRKTWNCSSLTNVPDTIDFKQWMKEEVAFRANGKYSDNFPHYTTNDQSFYIDQTSAWVGLGYLQAKKLIGYMY